MILIGMLVKMDFLMVLMLVVVLGILMNRLGYWVSVCRCLVLVIVLVVLLVSSGEIFSDI